MPRRGYVPLGLVAALGAALVLSQPTARASSLALFWDAAASAPDPALRVHVVDYAAPDGDELTHAESEASRLWRAIGVGLTWASGEIPSTTDTHMSRPAGIDVTLVLLNHDMAQRMIIAEHRSDGVLGRAVPEALRAYVFYDRVKTVGAELDVRRGDVLGRVAAHELAHLMLGHTHSHGGLFRAEPNLGSPHEAFDAGDGAKIRGALARLAR
jgi:hypothetical protein